MEFNKSQIAKLIKIQNVLKDCYDNGRLKKYKLLQYEVELLRTCYNDILYSADNQAITFNLNVANLFKREGFSVNYDDDGINFIIKISD